MPDRTYTEEEVAELFRRASELQASQPLMTADRPGLTIEELSAIAADSGLDPEHLRIAAAEMDGGRRRRAASHVSSREISVERWVPGHLSDLEKEDIIADLRHRYDTAQSYDWGMGTSYGKSSVQQLGRSIEWHHTHPWYGTQHRVLIQPREDGVRIRVTQNNVYTGSATSWSPWHALFIVPAAGFIAAPVMGSIVLGVLAALVALVVSVPLLIRFSRAEAVKRKDEVERLADEIAAHVKPLATPAQEPQSPRRADVHPQLDIPTDEFESDAAPARRQVRER